MSKEIVIQFNQIFTNFLSQLTPKIGTKYLFYVEKILKVNSLILIENFIIKVLPHKEQIENKDDAYFSDENFKTKLIEENHLDSDTTLNEILRLQKIYFEVDKQSQNSIWTILNALVKLSSQYLELKLSN
jgi:hypothetical protein